MADYEKIELRSEKVRKIIGEIPSKLIRNGIGIIFSIIIALTLFVLNIPYRESIKTDILFGNTLDSSRVAKGVNVKIELEGFENREYGYITGHIEEILPNVICIGDKNYLQIKIRVESHTKK